MDNYEEINKLVEKAKNNDSVSLNELYEFYTPLIRTSIRRCTIKYNSIRYVDDVIQESYFIFKKLVELYDPELSFFSYYLATRIDRAIVNLIKCKFTYLEEIDEKEIQELKTYDPYNKVLDKIILKDAMLKLNDKQREAIDLYFFQEYTQEEAADLLNITQASFSRRIDRALESLKKLLEEEIV
jgi:RNA polymerase sigma factor (sigma-70 family)